jgi:hypothetical protein
VQLRLGDHLIQTYAGGELASLQSTVALLRTIFADHFVDPEHQSSLSSHDFTVVHRSDRVVLSDFTFKRRGPFCVALPVYTFAIEVVRFAEQILALGLPIKRPPEWQMRYVHMYWLFMIDLIALARRFILGGGIDFAVYSSEYHQLHGHLQRPLEMQIVEVLAQGAPRQPITALSRIKFGPVRANESLPVRLNHGDVVLATVDQFTNDGVVLTLQGVGSGGLRVGDLLHGLQLFYP